MEPRTWNGPPPTNCDICDCEITTEFVDGRTGLGPWANMCRACHKTYGCGLGTGNGQRYVLQNGTWLNAEDTPIPVAKARKPVGFVLYDPSLMFPQVQEAPPPPRPGAKGPVEEAPIKTVADLLEDRTDRGKQFRALIALCDPVVDGAILMREFGFSSDQIVKYCKNKGRGRSDDVPEVRDDIDLGPIRP